VVARPCEASWEARHTIWIVCGPFAAWGAKGEARVPLAIGWEVPVRSRRSASKSGMERADIIRGRELRQRYGFFLVE
jgi:hypothetical protein